MLEKSQISYYKTFIFCQQKLHIFSEKKIACKPNFAREDLMKKKKIFLEVLIKGISN